MVKINRQVYHIAKNLNIFIRIYRFTGGGKNVFAKTSTIICALTMLTTGFMGCIPVSAENAGVSSTDTSISPLTPPQESYVLPENATPLIGEHILNYQNWYINWLDCDLTWPTGGTHIKSVYYNGFSMITAAYQPNIRYKIYNDQNWYDLPIAAASSCSYWSGVDGQGNMRYGSQITWNFQLYGYSYQVIFTPSFALNSNRILLYLDFRYTGPSLPRGITSFEGWWLTFYPQGTVRYHNGQTLHNEMADQPVYWINEEFRKDANHKMYTNSYGFGGPNGYFTEGWAAFEHIEDYSKYWVNADGDVLAYPSGGDCIKIENNGAALRQNQDYWFNSIWIATATD